MIQSIFPSPVSFLTTATFLVILFGNAAIFSQSIPYTSALQQQLQHDRGLALLTGRPASTAPPQRKRLADATTYEPLIRAMGGAVRTVSTINSLAAITVPNMEKAGLASISLLQKLLATREVETDQTLVIRLDEAILAMIQFVNNNNVVPEATLIRRQGTVILKNGATGHESNLDEAKGVLKSHLANERVDTLRKRIQSIDSMSDLLSVMEEASRYQDGLRRIGAALRRVAETLGAHVDFRPIESFAFQLFRR